MVIFSGSVTLIFFAVFKNIMPDIGQTDLTTVYQIVFHVYAYRKRSPHTLHDIGIINAYHGCEKTDQNKQPIM